ncbi:MAG: PP2C family protein-serine/threonine phosphatase [bacterium]|nr:PP2C family protein-serine/threonine phosphatase [bacterium]
MSITTTPVDYRNLMKKVGQVADAIERGDEETITVHLVAGEIIAKLRDDLGIYGGRLYERDGDGYVVRATYPDAKEVAPGTRVSRSYAPVDLCLLLGTVYMTADDPRIDPELEAKLGVKEFAAVEVGNEDYILSFNVAPGHDREDILFSLGVVRRSINEKIRKQRMEGVFRQARQIQASILPRRVPEHGRFSVAGHSVAMESVGGDLYDFIPITDKILGLAIADASGHGLPAALQVRDIYVGLRMGLARDFKIVRTIERLNNIIHESALTSRFVSMFYGELEWNGTFIYVNAGHPPPFHITADGSVNLLDQGGPVLGPLAQPSYDRGFVRMSPGDQLVIYTDGITEALRFGDTRRGEEYGTKRLQAVVRANRGKSASEVVDAVFESLGEWSGEAQSQDDSTLIVVVYPP